MAKKEEVEKVKDGVQGTLPVTETFQEPDFGDLPEGKELVAETPQWVNQILESNQRVIDSNNGVIEAVKAFGEPKSFLQAKEPEKKPEVVVNRKAKYVVGKGKKFADKEAGGVIREAGYEVSKFSPERLENLLSQGLIEEAK